jgi:hypothetical protein
MILRVSVEVLIPLPVSKTGDVYAYAKRILSAAARPAEGEYNLDLGKVKRGGHFFFEGAAAAPWAA